MSDKPWQFKPGVSPNPTGRPKLPDDVREAKQLTQEEFIRTTNRFLGMSKEELQAAVKDPATTALELLVAGIISKAIVDGDSKRGTFILDRILGKVPENFNIKGSIHSHLLQEVMKRYQDKEEG